MFARFRCLNVQERLHLCLEEDSLSLVVFDVLRNYLLPRIAEKVSDVIVVIVD